MPRRTIGRRSLFFAFAAAVCVALVPFTPASIRWATWASAGLGFFWAVLLAIEELVAPWTPTGEAAPGPEPARPRSPFAPPPPPGSNVAP